MQAFKCDRCGKYYDHYATKAGEYNSITIVRHSINGDISGYKDLYMLCPECMKALDMFVETKNAFIASVDLSKDCDPVQKAYDILVKYRNDTQFIEFDLDEVIGYLGEALE